mmetsp:Transcript_53572/g.138494  ORF Transcript_53572/g.138494 Transcript_53572/m.138494 type:complete len:329 (-) Transcript_53572:291-1277(-)
MFGGLILAAVVISSFTSAFASMDQKQALAGQQLDVIRNYLLLKAVPTELRARILEYYQYIFTSSQSLEDLQLLQHMPPNLATQLALSINAKLLSRSVVFHEMSDASLASLVQSLSPLVFVPGQIICTEGTPLLRIYFLNRGHVQLVRRASSETEKVIRVVTESESIGMDDFTSSDRRIALTARALSYCDVMSLMLRDLDAALQYDAVERMRAAAEAESERAGEAPSTSKRSDPNARFKRAGALMMAASRMGGRKAGAELPLSKSPASLRAGTSQRTTLSVETAPSAAPADDHVVECISGGGTTTCAPAGATGQPSADPPAGEWVPIDE